MVRGIRPRVEGREVVDVRRCPCECRPLTISPRWPALRRRMVGQTISVVRRLAKRIVLDLSSGDCCVIEPRMTGLMLVADPPDTAHLRFEFELRNGSSESQSLWFWDRRGLGIFRLLTPQQFAEQLGPEKIGPDALEIEVAEWASRLKKTGRPVKVAMLDQRLVAGIGNLYASEILHRAGISPKRAANRLSRMRIERLHAATREILQTAIQYEGSTLGDGTYRNALNQDGSYQNQHRVYAREGDPCPGCVEGTIRRIVQAQRATFYCPRCQR